MVISVGNRLPSSSLVRMTDSGLEQTTIDQLTVGRKVILFGLPGAFTPTCSEKHMPSYIKCYQQLSEKGIEDIYCLSVNDEFVLNAWLLSYSETDGIKGIADGNGDIAKSLNLLVDKSANYMGMRSTRFAMIVENNIIQELFLFWVVYLVYTE